MSGVDGKTADVFFSMKVYAKKQGIQDSIANGRVKKIVREPAEKEQEQSKRDRAREPLDGKKGTLHQKRVRQGRKESDRYSHDTSLTF